MLSLCPLVGVTLLEVVPHAVMQVRGGNAGALMNTSRLWKSLDDIQAGRSLMLAVHDAECYASVH